MLKKKERLKRMRKKNKRTKKVDGALKEGT